MAIDNNITDEQILAVLRPFLDKADGGYVCDTESEHVIAAGRALLKAVEIPQIFIAHCHFKGANPDGSAPFEFYPADAAGVSRLKSFKMDGWICQGPEEFR